LRYNEYEKLFSEFSDPVRQIKPCRVFNRLNCTGYKQGGYQMGEYEQDFEKEKLYLDVVLEFLNNQIYNMRDAFNSKKHLLHRTRHEQGILQNDFSSAGHSSDLSQLLLEDSRQLSSIEHLARNLEQYERMLLSPYFGRFDFKEDGFSSPDKIYMGLHNLFDAEGDGDILIYDWRAPICSIFYRSEPGHASYTSPDGEVIGEITIKRQYRIEHSILKYFFNCSLVISDEILGEALSQNSSPTMRNIVTTIQSEQDLIIRDTKSDLLIAQGAAGSGKTTIALHRIAYLLYHSAMSGLTSKNIVIISLCDIFSLYIGAVLPELGEENVTELTFDTILTKIIGLPITQNRESFSESLLCDEETGGIARDTYVFKGSTVFAEILKRFLAYYEQNIIPFEDIYYNEILVAGSEELKASFLNNPANAPALSRLRRIESILLEKLHPLQRQRHKELQSAIMGMEEHKIDYKTVSRYLAIKESQQLLAKIRNFTRFDAAAVYTALFADRSRFTGICDGLELPANIEAIFEYSANNIKNGFGYSDAAPLAFLSLLTDNTKYFDDIRHVVIDEAQDYLPLHYAIFGRLFAGASYTVLGDISQSVETGATMSIYEEAAALLHKKHPLILNLLKSYRSSYEIMNFALKIPKKRPVVTPFERHEKEPELIKCCDCELESKLVADIHEAISEGFGTVAVICKTAKQALALYERLRGKIHISLLHDSGEVWHGAVILPAYLSKGLEFDCVFVPDLSDENYGQGLGQRLLYISCTRALHRLKLYYENDCEIVKRLLN
jgi:DNA helicase-2/ATP-dependent DNA helicase PcrA